MQSQIEPEQTKPAGAAASLQFSIVIPAYNSAAFLRETMESVRGQDASGWELIVVDDGSTDGSLDVARSVADPRIRVLRQENRGVSAARNRGLAEASGEWVLFLDSDDRLLPDALRRMGEAGQARPEAVAVYGEAAPMSESGDMLSGGAPPVFGQRPSGDVLEALLARNFIATPGVIALRRHALAQSGGFSEGLSVAEDWELWCRLAMLGTFHYLGGGPVLAYRLRQGSVVRSTGLQPEHALACVAAIFGNPEIEARLASRAPRLRRRAEASVHSFTANEHLRRGNWSEARRLLRAALRGNPAAPREWILWVFAALQWLPKSVKNRLK